MLCVILYHKKYDKARFADQKKRFKNNYVLSKAEYSRTVTVVQILLLNYQPNYNSNRQSQSQGAVNQLMFTQRGKTKYDKGEVKEENQKSQRNLDQITCNDCGKIPICRKIECSNQAKLKEDTEAFSKTEKVKSGNKPPDGGEDKTLVNVEVGQLQLVCILIQL